MPIHSSIAYHPKQESPTSFQLKNNNHQNINHLWGIVLAGGEGKRLEQFISSRFGTILPKQYCTFCGTRSMLSHTLSRVKLLVPHEHIIVTIQNEHKTYAVNILKDIPERNIVVQPMNRETGVGIIHTLLRIYHEDSQALVAIFPSDHFVLEEERFMESVEDGIAFVKKYKEQMLILGVEPEHPESEYGWIKPGAELTTVRGSVIHRVSYFWEKPSTKHAIELYENKCLWNTSVLIGSAHTMLSRCNRLMPEIVIPILSLSKHLHSPFEYAKTKEVYEKLPSVNFSYSMLQSNVEEVSTLRVKNVYWSDWGNPQRIEKDITHIKQRSENKYHET